MQRTCRPQDAVKSESQLQPVLVSSFFTLKADTTYLSLPKCPHLFPELVERVHGRLVDHCHHRLFDERDRLLAVRPEPVRRGRVFVLGFVRIDLVVLLVLRIIVVYASCRLLGCAIRDKGETKEVDALGTLDPTLPRLVELLLRQHVESDGGIREREAIEMSPELELALWTRMIHETGRVDGGQCRSGRRGDEMKSGFEPGRP